MNFRKGFKYQKYGTETFETDIMGYTCSTGFMRLQPNGFLTILDGYAWDGPSGLTFDTQSSYVGSLVHDALYELLRKRLLPSFRRVDADRELLKFCLASKMWAWRARAWYKAVRLGAGPAADPKNKKKVFTAEYDLRRVA